MQTDMKEATEPMKITSTVLHVHNIAINRTQQNINDNIYQIRKKKQNIFAKMEKEKKAK